MHQEALPKCLAQPNQVVAYVTRLNWNGNAAENSCEEFYIFRKNNSEIKIPKFLENQESILRINEAIILICKEEEINLESAINTMKLIDEGVSFPVGYNPAKYFDLLGSWIFMNEDGSLQCLITFEEWGLSGDCEDSMRAADSMNSAVSDFLNRGGNLIDMVWPVIMQNWNEGTMDDDVKDVLRKIYVASGGCDAEFDREYDSMKYGEQIIRF